MGEGRSLGDNRLQLKNTIKYNVCYVVKFMKFRRTCLCKKGFALSHYKSKYVILCVKGMGPNSNAVFPKTLLQKRCFGNASENAFSWAVVVRFIEFLYNSNI